MKLHFGLCGTQDMVKIFSFSFPFQPVLLRCLIYSVLEREHKYTKVVLAMGAIIGGDASKNGTSTHELVLMRVRLL